MGDSLSGISLLIGQSEALRLDRPTYSGAGTDLSLGAKNICQLTLTLIPPLGPEDNGGHGRLQQKSERSC